MPRARQPKGTCAFCGADIAKNGAPRHLSACSGRQTRIRESGRKTGSSETLFYLRVRNAYNSPFWLELEMRGSATLADLDHYLRCIWLECCGHLSRFSMGGWRSKEIAMTQRIRDVFEPGVELTHIYDFGTSSYTLVKAVETRVGQPLTRHPVVLMARNVMPQDKCIECEQPANWLCFECVHDRNVWGTLCDKHARRHPHRAYGEPSRLVNSPRLGSCGYIGPAEPPY